MLVKICIHQRLDGSASELEGEFFASDVGDGGFGIVVGGEEWHLIIFNHKNITASHNIKKGF